MKRTGSAKNLEAEIKKVCCDGPTAIDLFAGGGGLSVALKRAGYAVAVAVEIENHAAKTFKANHPDVIILRQDIRKVSGQSLVERIPQGVIGLLAGCPPCQGFTSLTSKYKRPDERNYLVREMARLVEETKPQAVMMENVPGLASRGKALLDEFINRIEKIGYSVNLDILQVADYGVPQSRKRFVLLAGLGYNIPMPKPSHSKHGGRLLLRWRTVRDTIETLVEPLTFSDAKQAGKVEQSNWHIVRNISEQNKQRLQYARPGGTWRDIPERMRPRCHQGDYVGFQNVYGRMEWDTISPTITGGCTSPSKGRFGHPNGSRTISVREAALLQTLPNSYEIATPFIDKACEIVGNALPCDFGEAVANKCMDAWKNQHVTLECAQTGNQTGF